MHLGCVPASLAETFAGSVSGVLAPLVRPEPVKEG